jgi:hypothetical protein
LKVGDAHLPPWQRTQLPQGREERFTVLPGQKISAYSPTIQTISVVEITQ